LVSVGHLAFIDSASAAILWQQDLNTGFQTAAADQKFPDAERYDVYIVSDVTFDSAVRIETISAPFTDRNAGWPLGKSFAILNIFPVDAALDTEDVTLGLQVPVTISLHSIRLILDVTATNLSIELPGGSYWVGLTPILDSVSYGQEYHLPAVTEVGQPSYVRNPGGGFGFGTDWVQVADLSASYRDAAITILGT
jgi:hypothetical protein